ncbi:MAG: hypothetical protein JRH08_08155 [Deltaproteobacteria bacterium]|nr:hypothetical protein [Deltaproteobacteria bacterium]MBW1928631.1 hypothetical protein [Deltaproteobacteria bacterium]MBW2024692.1 hypothetical protein [Deltaproteobacteria bacterium]MBW2125655.1 hypothetical protein [Deltaproteobacteria bacterium]
MVAGGDVVIKSTCGLCQAGCGILIYMKGKEPERIEGDPESPVNRGWLCSKGLAALEYLHHPNRLTQPLKRRGGKGSGAWEKITWDKALDLLAPSGKVELYSSRLAEWGFDPLPDYREIPGTQFSDPEIAKDYPLLFTSWKSEQYRHSSGRQIAALRAIQPEPIVWIHPDTATEYGIQQGDWVFIQTKRGKIKQKAMITPDIAPGTIGVDYGWWFPEKGNGDLYGWADSNINILTDDERPYGKELGSPTLRGIACKITKVTGSGYPL